METRALVGENRTTAIRESDGDLPGAFRWAGWAIGGVVVAIVVGLQAWWLRPPFGFDPTSYLTAATRLPHVPPEHRTLRIGLLVPFRLALELFGETQMAFYLVPLFAVALMAGATYWLGSMLFTRWVGAAAAVVAVANPVVMTWSSQPYPDLLAAGLFTMGIAVFVHMAERSSPTDRIGIVLALVAGALFGWSYLTRELMVFLAPVVFVAARMWRVRPRLLVLVSAGAAMMLVGEWVWGALFYDDPLIRWRALFASQGQDPGGAIAAGVEAMRAQGIASRVGTFVLILSRAGGGPLWLLLLALGLLSPLLTPGRGARLALWWFGTWYVFLTVANFSEVLRASDLIRYWYPIFPAYALAGVAGLSGLVAMMARRRWRSWAPSAAVVVLLVLALAVTWVDTSHRPGFTRNDATAYEEFRSWLRTLPADTNMIWTDQKTAAALRLYTASFFGTSRYFEGEIVAFNTAKRFRRVERIDEGYVVLQDEFFRPRLADWGDAVPEYLSDPPQDWVVVEATTANDLVMFRVAERPSETILFDVGRDARFGWRQLQPVASPMSDDPGPGSRTVTAAPSSQVLVGDDTSRGMGSRPRTATVEAGDILRFQVTLDVAGAADQGWADFLCVFYEGDTRTTSIAATGWRPDLDRETAEFFCRVPSNLTGDVTVRGAVRLLGPIEARLHTMTAAVSNG